MLSLDSFFKTCLLIQFAVFLWAKKETLLDSKKSKIIDLVIEMK